LASNRTTDKTLTPSAYLTEVWDKRIPIGILIVLAVVIAGFFSLLEKPRYEATAQAILLPPQVTKDSRVPPRPLTLLAMEQILHGANVADTICERLRSASALAKTAQKSIEPNNAKTAARKLAELPKAAWESAGASPELAAYLVALEPNEIEAMLECSSKDIDALGAGDVSRALSTSTSVETRMATDLIYSPVMLVRATLPNPALARAVANTAGHVAVERHEALVREQSETSWNEIEAHIKDRRDNIAAIDREIEAATKTLGAPKAIEHESDACRRELEEILRVAPAETKKIDDLRNRIRALEAQYVAASERIDSLQTQRMAYMVALRYLIETQDSVRTAGPVTLGSMRFGSDAGSSARRVETGRLSLVGGAAVTAFIVGLAGVFVTMVLKTNLPSSSPAPTSNRPVRPAGAPDSRSGGNQNREGGGSRGSRGGRPFNRRPPRPSVEGGNSGNPDRERRPSGGASNQGVTTIRPDNE
jgi:hypothetical protein